MVATTISSSGTVGVTLTSGGQNPVTIASTGTIKVSGANVSAIYGAYGVPGTIVNAGVLAAANGYGIRLLSGGNLTNGSMSNTNASVTGALYGVKFGVRGSATVSNFGTIANTSTTTGMGVFALGTGTLTNGSATDTTASISGYKSGVRITGAGAVVNNFGTVSASSLFGSAVYLRAGGTMVNGGADDTTALLNGVGFGIEIQHAAGSVTNFGTVQGTGTLGQAIVLQAGGSVVNGSNDDTAACILASGRNAVYIGGNIGGTVTNYGTIRSVGPVSLASNGIAIRPGGTVTNGSASDVTASIVATRDGIYLQGLMPSAVINFGTIRSTAANGLNLYLGATVTNGTTADVTAIITGVIGIYDGGVTTIVNMGTISGTSKAISLGYGGTVINGGTSATVATIIGGAGITDDSGSATISNFGTIAGTAGSGLVLTGGGEVINGGSANFTASITATSTAVAAGPALMTVSNFGSITGALVGIGFNGGGSVSNGSTADTKALISGGNTGVAGGAVQTSVTNFGTISGTAGAGVFLTAGGPVANGSFTDTVASISGANYGVREGVRGVGSVVNFGTISATSGTSGAGVALFSTGAVVNGASNSTVALISGFYDGVLIRGAGASVSNFGKITAASTLGIGVYLTAGGNVTNGASANTSASIVSTGTGVEVSHYTGTIANFGTIRGGGLFGRGVVLKAGGTVVNGSLTDTAAYIGASSRNAVYIGDAGPSYVTNFGTIRGTGPAGIGSGVAVRGGGTVINGAETDRNAIISGNKHGIYITGAWPASVLNFGTITSSAKASVCVYLGGSVTNGSNADTSALITGPTGVYLGATGTVTNFGTITGTANPSISLSNGGAVINGSATDMTALINATGAIGAQAAIYGLTGLTTVTNFGTIKCSAAAVRLNAGGTIVNGSIFDKAATMTSLIGAGVYVATGTAMVTNFGVITGAKVGISFNGTVSATGTVSNAGTISNALGTAGLAIAFGTGTNRLVAAPGAVFIGTVSGGGTTTVELASGGPTVGAIGGFGTSFTNISTVVVDSGASWAIGKANVISTLVNSGTVFVAPNGKIQITTVDPASTGIFQLNASSILEIAAHTGAGDKINFLGASELIVDRASAFGFIPIPAVNSPTYSGPQIQHFTVGDKLHLMDVAFSSTALKYNATLGLLQVFSGTKAMASLLFEQATLGTGSFRSANDGLGHTMITHG